MTGPLRGWRILEVAHDVPAAFCTKILADLGADVVMAEPSTGHPLRAAAPRRADGVSARFAHLSTGKRSVVVDGTADDEALQALVTAADVLVTDLAPARADALVGPAAGAIYRACRSPRTSTAWRASRRSSRSVSTSISARWAARGLSRAGKRPS